MKEDPVNDNAEALATYECLIIIEAVGSVDLHRELVLQTTTPRIPTDVLS